MVDAVQTQGHIPVATRAVRLAWESDATALELPARAAWMRWRLHRDGADPARRVMLVPASVPPEGDHRSGAQDG